MVNAADEMNDEDDMAEDAMMVDPKPGGSRLRQSETIDISDDDDS